MASGGVASDLGASRGSILVLNAGSSTLKASLLAGTNRRPLATTTRNWDAESAASGPAILDAVLRDIGVGSLDAVAGVGHRVVHGGPDLVAPVRIDRATRAALGRVADLAPLHVPPSLAVIDAVTARAPAALQVACFDTAFHARMPATVRRYPVPRAWSQEAGIVRYGFHGLSVEWAVRRAAELLGTTSGRLRLVVAHLGAGASVTAVHRGRSVHTSMGYTPLEGLMMATRSGSIDPGILVALVREGRRTIDEVEDDLLHRSGLLGVGGSADMREILAWARDGDPDARLAIAMFVDRAAAAIAAAASRLGRVDAIVFTGGIGEGAAAVRAGIVRRLTVLGVAPIPARARRGDVILGGIDPGRPAVLRIEAREDLVIAAAVAHLARRGALG